LLKDKVNVPNVIFQKLVDAANTSSLYRFVIEEACRLRGESAFITTTVGELLFEGYDDPLISAICNHTIMRSICATLGVPPRIGLFYGQNNTDDGVYKIHTGLGSVKDIGHVYSWNNMTTLNTTYWYGQGARMINGTDGQLFKPDLEVNQPLHIFVGQICRTVAMDHKGYATFEDVPSYRYGPSRSMNDIQLERSLGFCNPASPIFFQDSYIQEKGCSPPGILDASSCLPSSPRIYISQPHFLNSPPPIREALVGLKEPSESSDSTFVDIEPKSGVVVQAKRRSQINVGVLRGNLVSLQNMSNIIVPIIWLNETAVFDADTRAQLLQLVSIAHTSKTVSIVLLVVSGMLLLLYAGSFLVEYHMKKREEEVGSDIGGDEQPLIADLNPEEQ
jgi:lysosome membrane protein 2